MAPSIPNGPQQRPREAETVAGGYCQRHRLKLDPDAAGKHWQKRVSHPHADIRQHTGNDEQHDLETQRAGGSARIVNLFEFAVLGQRHIS